MKGPLAVNPLTATACKISGLKDGRTRLQTVYFRSWNTSAFSAMRFDENPFTCQLKKKKKKFKRVSNFALLIVVSK